MIYPLKDDLYFVVCYLYQDYKYNRFAIFTIAKKTSQCFDFTDSILFCPNTGSLFTAALTALKVKEFENSSTVFVHGGNPWNNNSDDYMIMSLTLDTKNLDIVYNSTLDLKRDR